jgi:ompA
MKRKILIAGLFLGGVAASNLSAQKYLGLSNSNYSGVYGSQYNPAKLTDEKVKVAVNLASFNGLVNNDYYKFKNLDSFGNFSLEELGKGASHNAGNGTLINMGIVGEVLGPSFQFTVNNRLGFGFSSRARIFSQGKNVNSNFINALNGNLGTDNPGLATIPLVDNTGFGINTTALTDLGVKGAYAVIDNNDLKLSLGASVKLYKGAGLNRFESNGHNLIYNNNPSNPTISATNINWDLYTNLNPEKSLNDYFGDFFGGATGFGGDFGAELTLKEASGDKPYFLKFGASVNDIGAIKYNDIRKLSIRGAGSAIDPNEIDIFDLNATADYLRTRGYNTALTTSSVSQGLPTNLNLYADYAITKRFFVSANGLINLANTNSTNPYYHSFVGLVPRFESKWVDVSVPLTYNFMSQDFKPGLALRLGPLSIGSDDLKILFTESKGANIYAGLGFILYKGKKAEAVVAETDKDTDGDGVLDRHDECPTVPGPIENRGCPWGDTDNDGVLDKDDKCPDVPGPVENEGCPWKDTDGDGIPDKDDRCPTEAGLPEKQGCPKTHADIAGEVTSALKNILFNLGKATLRPEAMPKLDEAAKIIKSSNGGTFLVIGHTDRKGNAALNLRLSRERAAAVVKALEERGVEHSQLKSKGVGFEFAEVPVTASDAEREKDRKVEVKHVTGSEWDALTKSDVPVAAPKKTTAKKSVGAKKTVYRKPVARKKK